jgi:hypothetical protein
VMSTSMGPGIPLEHTKWRNLMDEEESD